jgi:LCP family protein required for cell wall assembly
LFKIKDMLKRSGEGCKRLGRKVFQGISRAFNSVCSFFARAGRALGNKFNRAWFKKYWKVLTGAALALGLLIAAVIVFVNLYQIAHPEVALKNPEFDFAPDENVNKQFSEHIVNIAVLGFDRDQFREEYAYLFLPDVILIASIDFKKDLVKFVRVPRDSYVPIHGRNVMDKINHSYYHGYFYGKGADRDDAGLSTTLQTVSHLLGDIPIHYYVTVSMDAVVQLVDAMGGVHYTVERRIYDKQGNVLLYEGPQDLDGISFLTYARYREGATGQDIGRIERQMDLLMATFDHFKEQGRFKNIPVTYRVYKDHVNTNLSYKQIAALAYYASTFKKTEENIKFHTLTGGSQTKDGIWYWVLNQGYRVKLIKEVFGLNVAQWPADVLRDTPPPPPGEFIYTIQEVGGNPAILLSWMPGDSKKVVYNLYRSAEGGGEILLAEGLEETFFQDTDVVTGNTYLYRLVVRHYRADGPPVSLTVQLAEPEIRVTAVTLDFTTLSLKVGESKQLIAIITPENAANKNVTWSSNNHNVAVVENGLVTAVAEGEATITVTTEDGALSAHCIVTVTPDENAQGDEEPEDSL